MKILRPTEVTRINAKKGNRRVTRKGIERLDPDGFNLFVPFMSHNDGAEMRGTLYMKLVGEESPAVVYFDIPMKDYAGLEEVEV